MHFASNIVREILKKRTKRFFEPSNTILRAVTHLTVLLEVPREEEDVNVFLEDWKKYAKVKVIE